MSDNYNKNCPAKMSDGRFITDYKNSKYRDLYISHINGMKSHTEYRNFLSGNAEKIISNINEYHNANNAGKGNSKCVHVYATTTNMTEMAAERAAYDNKGN